jgi:hypothetical protein
MRFAAAMARFTATGALLGAITLPFRNTARFPFATAEATAYRFAFVSRPHPHDVTAPQTTANNNPMTTKRVFIRCPDCQRW